VKRPESALAALLLTLLAAAPAAAQQLAHTHQQAVSGFCSGCFAYLEFPPVPGDGDPSGLPSKHENEAAIITAAHESRIVAVTPAVASVTP